MHEQTDSRAPVKKLGELLFESGFVTEPQIQRAIDIANKNFQSLGKVLVSTKICTDASVTEALEMQKICKHEGMSGNVAVRALTLIRKDKLTRKEALDKVGWTSPTYKANQEPENIAVARQALKDLNRTEGIPYANAIESIGDAFAENKMPGRAEQQYEDALLAYEKCLPVAAGPLALLLTKMSKLALADERKEEARALLERAQTCLQNRKDTREYAKVMHALAEYQIALRNLAEAEKYYKDCFLMLEPTYGLEDTLVLDTIRKFVQLVDKGSRDDSKVSLSEIWHEMAHEREPDKITLGELLKGARLLEDKDLEAAWQHSKKTKAALGQSLLNLNLLSDKQLQLTLAAQTMVRNGEVTAQLGTWLLLYAASLDIDLDQAIKLLHCSPRKQAPLSEELKAAIEKLQNMEKRLPPTHSDLAFAHANIARIYFYRQQHGESDQHYKRAVEMIATNPDVPAESLVELLDHYAELKLAQADANETIRISKIALQARAKYYGMDSVPYAKGVEKLSQIFCDTGDHRTAVTGFDRALSVRQKLFGQQDAELIDCLILKSECLIHCGNLTAAELVLDECLAIADICLGPYNEMTGKIKKKLAGVCESLGNNEKAKMLGPEAVNKHHFFKL